MNSFFVFVIMNVLKREDINMLEIIAYPIELLVHSSILIYQWILSVSESFLWKPIHLLVTLFLSGILVVFLWSSIAYFAYRFVLVLLNIICFLIGARSEDIVLTKESLAELENSRLGERKLRKMAQEKFEREDLEKSKSGVVREIEIPVFDDRSLFSSFK